MKRLVAIVGLLCWLGKADAQLVLPQPGQSTYVTNPGDVVSITNNRSVTLNPGTSLQGTVTIRIDNAVTIAPPPSNPSADLDRNWVMSRSYDEDGHVIAESKSFYDSNGRATQAQSKSEATQQVLATQTIYDLQQRAAVTTLSAPINNADFAYTANFVTSNGNPYGYTNFDGDPATGIYSKANNPDPVDNTLQGTLGWYYSNNNNQEPLVGATGFPYARTDFYKDGSQAVSRTAGVGEGLKMGSGHETAKNAFPVINELSNYLAIRNQFFNSAAMGEMPASMTGKGLQTISTDPNGLQAVAITDLSGKALMSGRADPNGWLTATNTITLTPAANDFEVTINTNGKSTGDIFPVANFSISSPDPVIVTRDGVLYSNGTGNNFVFDYASDPLGGSGYTYVLKSQTPFYYSTNAVVIPLINPNIALAVDAPAKLIESPSSSLQYFQITSAQNITITGPYQLFDMKTETDLTTTFSNGSVLPAGYYRLMAKPGYVPVNQLIPVSMSYSNSFSDISYNYYNQLGQLIASVAPNGVKALIDAANNSTLAGMTAPPFTTINEYDLQGRLIASTSPDGGRSEFIYRRDGKIRFSQNALQRNAHSDYTEKFSYTDYDAAGRPVESGEYLIPPGSAQVFQAFKSNDALLENTDPVNDGLTGGTKQDWVKTHFDLADPNIPIGSYVQDEGFLKGAVSWTENTSAKTWYNYDDQGRVKWLVKQISGWGNKTIDYTYNAQGNVITIDYQQGTPNERFVHHYSYDADARMTSVQTSRDGVNKLQQAKYYYYLHGPLKRVELGDQLQGIDYVYTPQGWLKSINHASGDPNKDPNQDGIGNYFAPDAFGMQLEYFNGDYTRQNTNINSISTGQQTFNGNVNGLAWQSKKPLGVLNIPGIQNPAMYQYNYDNKYQLLGASWGTPDFNSNVFTAPAASYSETVSGYDPNGNIQGMQRSGKTGAVVDDFSNYQYQSGTNRLNTAGSAASPGAYGTYAYNELGQLASVNMPGNPAMADEPPRTYYLKYNVTGLVTGIYGNPNLASDLQVSFTYDESGKRISRSDHTGTTYYIYDSNGNALATYNGATLTDMPVYGNDRLGTYTPASNSYVYELRDNVGSVRVVINRNKKSDGTADIVKYNDYYPFGSVAQSAGTDYKYDYQGAYAEKDQVTGFNNFELRLYDAKIGRWLSTDPKHQFASPYEGMGNNPVKGFDPTGGYDPPDDYVMDNEGNIELIQQTSDKFDRFFDEKGEFLFKIGPDPLQTGKTMTTQLQAKALLLFTEDAVLNPQFVDLIKNRAYATGWDATKTMDAALSGGTSYALVHLAENLASFVEAESVSVPATALSNSTSTLHPSPDYLSLFGKKAELASKGYRLLTVHGDLQSVILQGTSKVIPSWHDITSYWGDIYDQFISGVARMNNWFPYSYH